MRCLLLLLLSSFAYSESPPGEHSEKDVIENIHCSVYEHKKSLAASTAQPPNKAALKDSNVTTFEGMPGAKAQVKCKEKCTKDLGCFNCETYRLNRLPDFKSSAILKAFTREEQDGVTIGHKDVSPVLKLIDRPMQFIFIVHGFGSAGDTFWVQALKDVLLESEDAVVVTVDWQKGASVMFAYIQAIANSILAAVQAAYVLDAVIEGSNGNVTAKKTQWIGHGLGAQAAMFFWATFKGLHQNVTIGKITALDPSKHFFELTEHHVNVSMARFVEVIHTSGGDLYSYSYGMQEPIGHIDFYMNGGKAFQPGCDGNTGTYCSHFRAAEYYIEALQEKNGCSMLSYTCSGGLAQFEAGKCEIDDEYWNVISLEETEGFPGRGVQFVDTHRKSPYCKSMESSSEISSKDQ